MSNAIFGQTEEPSNEFQRAVTDGAEPVEPQLIEDMRRVEELSQSNSKVFTALCGACAYAAITVSSTNDAKLLSNSGTARLPLIDAEIPIDWFFALMPLLLLCLTMYFLLCLQRLWRGVAELYTLFPNKDQWGRRVNYWPFDCFARAYLDARTGEIRSLSALQRYFCRLARRSLAPTWGIVLTWGLLQPTLAWFWWRYLGRPQWTLESRVFTLPHYHAFLIGVATWIGFSFHTLAVEALSSDTQRRVPAKVSSRGRGSFAYTVVAAIVGGCLWYLSDHLQVSRNTFEGQDLHRLHLRHGILPAHENLRATNLSDADLQGAYLPEVNLNLANLQGANLKGARMRGAQLHHADLRNADLTSAQMAGADLWRADLSGADLPNINLTAAHLADTDLQRVDLSDAHLEQADLSSARLQGADLSRSHLVLADLSEAIMTRACLIGADLRGAHLEHAMLRDADLSGANLGSLSGPGKVEPTRLTSANLRGADLTGALLNNADLRETDFSDASVDAANLRGTILDRALSLEQAQLDAMITDRGTRVPHGQHRHLAGANLQSLDLTGVNMGHALLQGDNFRYCHFQGVNLRGADLRGADLQYAVALTQAQLDMAVTDRTTKVTPPLHLK